MNWKEISSHKELLTSLGEINKVFVLLYKKDSESCLCALKRLETQTKVDSAIGFLKVDVAAVKDIHLNYNISTVPSLLIFENQNLKNVVKGCMSEKYYKSIINGEFSTSNLDKTAANNKRVIVYSTPSCVWCTRLKNYFKERGVKYQEVDVAANQSKMEEMKKKSGQMGVPQTEIEGQMIIGFDKPKINRLLGLN